jgi:hypothetical protein
MPKTPRPSGAAEAPAAPAAADAAAGSSGPPDRAAAPAQRPAYPPRGHDPGTAAGDPEVLALAAALDEDPMFVSRTLRAFVRDGRLTGIPARDRKKRVVLRWLRGTAFAGSGPWSEPEVNMRIALVHPDVSALRRFMVDAGLLVRDAGVYRPGTD